MNRTIRNVKNNAYRLVLILTKAQLSQTIHRGGAMLCPNYNLVKLILGCKLFKWQSGKNIFKNC